MVCSICASVSPKPSIIDDFVINSGLILFASLSTDNDCLLKKKKKLIDEKSNS